MAFKMNSPLPMFGDPGKIGKNKEKEKNVLDAINDVSMQSKKFVPRSKKTTVKKETSKNSRANIKARKEADKAAGVSKSQMRANKAKSKAEAALEKAKKSKNPSYKAQLKRKADRLAARAKRKGGSPVKAIGDPKDPKKKKVIARKTKEKITPPAAKTQLDKLDILARRYPGYVHRPPRDYGYSSTNKKGNPNEYRLYNPKTGDSMTVYPDFGQNRKKNKQIDK